MNSGRRTTLLAGLLASSLLAGTAGTATAAARTLESVGAVGVRQGDRTDPKERAVQAALREAVWSVAEELLLEAILIEDSEGDEEVAAEGPDLQAILGKNMVVYTSRFKVLEDRGINPALFVEDPEVVTEYVVVAEVVVEVDRVRERLMQAGLLEPELLASSLGTVQLRVDGLKVYPALSELRRLLVEQVGAASATPVRFEHDRVLLAVATSLAGPDLVSALAQIAPEHLAIVPLSAAGGEARIAVRWTPPTLQAPADGDLSPDETVIPGWARP